MWGGKILKVTSSGKCNLVTVLEAGNGKVQLVAMSSCYVVVEVEDAEFWVHCVIWKKVEHI
jgi:hypothetical protein